jgi:hypothetical protein
VGDVDVFAAFGLDDVVDARVVDRNEVWLVVPEVSRTVGVLDGEPETARQLGEANDVARGLEELRKVSLELVVSGDMVEDRLACLERRSRERNASVCDSARPGLFSAGANSSTTSARSTPRRS